MSAPLSPSDRHEDGFIIVTQRLSLAAVERRRERDRVKAARRRQAQRERKLGQSLGQEPNE